MSEAALEYQYELAAFALLCFALLVSYHILRPGAHPRSVRGCVFLAFGIVAIYPAQFLVDDSAWKAQTIYRTVMNVPIVGIIVFLCYLVAGIEAHTTRRSRNALLSATVVLPLAWVFASVVGVLWPLPALQEATVPRSGVMPDRFLLYKVYLPLSVAYVALCASVFARAVWASRGSPLRKQLFQNLALLGLCIDIILLFLNSYVTAIARVTLGARGADLIRTTLALEFVFYVAGGALLLTAFSLHASAPNFDRLFNYCSSWVTNRRHLEAEIWRTSTAGISVSQEHCLTYLGQTPASDFLFAGPEEPAKAVYCLRLALTFSRRPSTRASGYHLLQLQRQILKLADDPNTLGPDSGEGLNYDLRNDLLHHTVRPATDLSHPNTVPNLLAAPFWQQLAAIAFAKSALRAGLVSPPRARLLLNRSVTGTAIQAYESIERHLDDHSG